MELIATEPQNIPPLVGQNIIKSIYKDNDRYFVTITHISIACAENKKCFIEISEADKIKIEGIWSQNKRVHISFQEKERIIYIKPILVKII